MLPPHKSLAIFKSKLLYSPSAVIGHCLQVHTPASMQTGWPSFPRVSASAQGRAKDSSSVLVLEFPRGNFTQYLNEELQTSLPVCYLSVHLTQNTLPEKTISRMWSIQIDRIFYTKYMLLFLLLDFSCDILVCWFICNANLSQDYIRHPKTAKGS